jgi:hypothetical protein
MDERRLAHMRDFIALQGDGFGRVVVVESQTDQYSVGFQDGRFVFVNFSPREYAEYGRDELSPEQAWDRLRAAGMTSLRPDPALKAAADRLRTAENELQQAVHDEPSNALAASEGDAAMASLVTTIPPGRLVDGFEWNATARIFGEGPDAGLSVWITEDTGYAGDREGGPNHWLVYLRFTERTSLRLRTAAQAAQARMHDLQTVVAAVVDESSAVSHGSSGDLSWLRQMPPEGTGDGRSWEVGLSADQASIIVSFTEDTRDPEHRIGPAPITGMAWVSIADS